MKPQGCKYAETHEWVRVKDKELTLGITDYAVSQLSDLVHVELPKVGDELAQGSPFGEIESVKTVADLVSPVTGKVIAINQELADSPDSITQDPYDAGWIVKISIADMKELDALMSAKEYESFLESAEEEDDDDSDDDDFM